MYPAWTDSSARAFRNQGRWTPVLMLMARDTVEDGIVGLDVGADDYLTKPSCSRASGDRAAVCRREPVAD